MKSVITCFVVLLVLPVALCAQEVEGVQKETTIKTVTTKGLNTEVTTTEETKETKSSIVLEKNDKSEDADYTPQAGKTTSDANANSTVSDNADNAAAIAALKKKQEEELAASKKAMEEEAKAKQKAKEEAYKKQKEEEMKKRKAALEKRPDGMVKLRKDN